MATERFHDIPSLLYGTAFKFEQSAALTTAAFHAGFIGLDTAGSASAYREALVGEGLKAFLDRSTLQRKDIFIQTKFSPFKLGKDPKLYPYDTESEIESQVHQSIVDSCKNLNTDYIDCLVLHSIYPDIKDTIRAWRAMETLVPMRVSRLGVSNISLATLRALVEVAVIKPATVQNRFTEDTKPNANMPPDLPYPLVPYDLDVRSFCSEQNIAYSPWGVLWGNPALMDRLRQHQTLLEDVGITLEVACLACVQASARCTVNTLCGTTRLERMNEVIQGTQKIREFCTSSEESDMKWRSLVNSVGRLINSVSDA